MVTTTISAGSFVASDTAAIKAFVDDALGALSSGIVFILPDYNTGKFWIGARPNPT